MAHVAANVEGICDVAAIEIRQPKYLMQPNYKQKLKLRAFIRHIANTLLAPVSLGVATSILLSVSNFQYSTVFGVNDD